MDFEMKNTGGVQSPPDERDFKLDIVAAGSIPDTLPDFVFINISRLPVWMQRKVGACVGHAWGKSQQNCELEETDNVVPLSARFLYAMAKGLDQTPGEGTFPRLVGKILKNYGCATEATVPNDTTLDHETYVYHRDIHNIPEAAFAEATPYKIDGYAFADVTEEGIKRAIFYAQTKRQGVVMLLQVGDTWWKGTDGVSTWDAAKILPLRVPATIISGHEVYPYGYEYKGGRLVIHILNSWSDQWGDHGAGWFYFDEWQRLIKEIMTSIDGVDVPLPVFVKDLSYGITHPDVLKLQILLNRHGFQVAQTGPGSPGHESTFFGQMTRQAVMKLQMAYKISPVSGFFGPLTRQVANKLSTQ